METIKVKNREFEITSEQADGSFIANFKNKQYTIIKFEPKTHEGDILTYSLKRIENSPVRSPKLKWIDKKNGYAVREYFEAENMMNYIAQNDIDEKIYDQLFKFAYFARCASMTLDYSPSAWAIKDGELFYIGFSFVPFKKEIDLIDKYLRLWFNTKELAEFLKNNGVPYDKNRIKDEYVVNKEIVLMACKYYR